jgi:hypothetical protein
MADKKEKTDAEYWAEFEKAEKGEEPDSIAEDAESANDDAAAAAPAQEPAAAAPEEPDIWANAPPDLKAAHDAQVRALEAATTEHSRRSIEGRIAAYTRRLQERGQAAAQQPKPAEEAADPLAELAAEYPEIATPLQQKLAPITEKLQQFDATLKSRQEAADLQMDAELNANERMLEERHPGWDEYLRENGAAFVAWINDQPLVLRQAFMTNKEAIIDPYSAIETLSAFKNFVGSNNQPPQPEAQAQPAAVNTQGLNSRRAAQLAGSASPQAVGSRPTVSGIPQDADPEALWKAWAAVDPEEKKYRSA